MVLLRKSTLKEPVSIDDPDRFGVSIVQTLPEEFFNSFEAQKYALVYNSEEIFAYVKEGQEVK
jgi:hypothetical protein